MITVTGLNKIFSTPEGPVHAVKDMSFEVPKGEFYTLLGPSGCGKSTTLRCIAGLERPEGGEISIDNTRVVSSTFSLPPNERDIGMVFQSYAIWPHMTVFKNVEFPLKQTRPKPSKAERKERVMNALSVVQMDRLASRPTPYLSGGQQQRVALARALVSNPKVLLLDEPLSNLDAKLREELRLEIKELVAPKELYVWPENFFVAQFIGQLNFFEGTVGDKTDHDMGFVENPHTKFLCPLPPDIEKGTKVTVAIRPQFFTISKRREGDENVLEGKVKRALFVGDSIHCDVSWAGKVLHIQLPLTTTIGMGDAVFLKVDPQYCRVFPGTFP